MKTSDRVLAVLAEIAAWFARVLLAFLLLFDTVLVIRCLWILVTEGPSQVHAWIVHISAIGYLRLGFWLLIAPPLLFWVQDKLVSLASKRAKRART